MKLKICGLKYPSNISEIAALRPDFMGFIFYENSPRYIDDLQPEVLHRLPDEICKVGVFVNASFDSVSQKVEKFKLDAVQLHGDETPQRCMDLKQTGLTVIKVFRVLDHLPQSLKNYEGKADFFLFDTKAKEYGGTGRQFYWSVLHGYESKTPFLLSGGISLGDIQTVKDAAFPALAGIDVNSKFEVKPGLKNIELLKKLKHKL